MIETEGRSESANSGSEEIMSESQIGEHNASSDPETLSDDDQSWLLKLGPRIGHNLARAGCLGRLFMARTPKRQVSMIRQVLGQGPMRG